MPLDPEQWLAQKRQAQNFGRGNIDLNNRPVVHNADGSISTVRSKSFNIDGKEILLPTVSPDGRIMSDSETIGLYKRTGQNLGSFDTVDEANRYAEQLHNDQAKRYVNQTDPESWLANRRLKSQSVTSNVSRGTGATGTWEPEPVNIDEAVSNYPAKLSLSNIAKGIDAGLAKELTLGYYDPTDQTNKFGQVVGQNLGMLPLLSAGGSALRAVPMVSRAFNAIKAIPPILGSATEAAALGAGYGAVRKPQEGESRLTNIPKDAGMFALFGAAGGIPGQVSKMMPKKVESIPTAPISEPPAEVAPTPLAPRVSGGKEATPTGYREVLSDEVLPLGSEVKMDVSTGKNYVKDYPDLAKPTGEQPVSIPAEMSTETPKEVTNAEVQTQEKGAVEGPTAESTLAIRTEAEAIAKKLTSDFGELPEYKTMNMAEQAQKAAETIAQDYEKAKNMALGKEAPPTGLREASIYKAVELRALKEGDAETLRQLAVESSIPSKLSEYGQAIKAADSGIMDDPVKVMQDIAKVRADRAVRTGVKISKEELSKLRATVDELNAKLKAKVSNSVRGVKEYGSRNKIVTRDAYLQAKQTLAKSLSTTSATPMFNPEAIGAITKIGTYHLEAGTRVFAEWSAKMIEDLGTQVKPFLNEAWDRINKDKKLQTALKSAKTRYANEAEKYNLKLEALDFTKEERRAIELDPEAKALKRKRDIAKQNYENALNASGTIGKKEAENIVRLAKEVEQSRIDMENGGDRFMYGANKVRYQNYADFLKRQNAPIKKQLREAGKEFATTWSQNKPKAVYNIGKDATNTIVNNSIAMVATLDNSFLGRQGLKTLQTHPSVWAKGAYNSFIDFGKTIGGKNAHDALMADIYSRENYMNGNYDKAGILNKLEEQFPTSLPERIPGVGRVFKASEYAFTGSAIRMRTGLFDLMEKTAKKNGVEWNETQIKDIGKMINSLTARGKWGQKGEPGVIRLVMWAPKMLKANLDVLTAHGLTAGLDTPFARKQAAMNWVKIIGETATLIMVANALKPGSAETDPRSSDFGKIKVGDTRFDITGGAGSIVTLSARLIRNSRKSTTTGEIIPLGGGFGQSSRFDVLADFMVGKSTPPARVVFDWLKSKDYKGDPFSPATSVYRAVTPITIQQAIQLKDNASADRVAGVILDGLGISSYSIDDKNNDNQRTRPTRPQRPQRERRQ